MSNQATTEKKIKISDENESHIQPELLLYPIQNEYIGQINIKPPTNTNTNNYTSKLATVVILDRSGSMGSEVERIVNIVLPEVFMKLQYSSDEKVCLITFDSSAERFDTTVGEMPSLQIFSQGTTYMQYAIEKFSELILNELLQTHLSLRLLTISDGEVWDQDETQMAANNLVKSLGQHMEINSQAVRLFTSICEPDTRAISSLLQLNNVSKVNLLDVSTELSNDEISTAISNLFMEDSLKYQLFLNSPENIFKKSPWLTGCTNKITLVSGDNLFWLSALPTQPLFIDDTIVPVNIQAELNLQSYEKLLRKKIEQYTTHLKVLKIVDTVEAATMINNVVNYFQKCENYMISKEEDVQLILNNPNLRSRIHYLKTLIIRRNKSFAMRMAQIANDEKISMLNSAQQAEYLRTVDNNKNSRGLARRALTQGIDFDETLRKEVKLMAEHIDELKDVDDKEHTVSFYSRETTLGGIKALCDLANQDILDEMNANDILLLINIVGIACSGPIGDFPDPMTWRADQIYLGCNVSLSDVLTAFVQSPGSKLKTPATEKEITNVIPFFEDNKIAKFLRSYAPSLLEYTCSIGMRRVIADVPMTCGYTICAAIWKMLEILNQKKTELHLKTFETLVLNYEYFVGKYFSHILPAIKSASESRNSYYIANNGITNMISPIITIYRLNDDKKQYMADILRALYTYEVWQAIRRLYKNKDNSDQIIKEMLTKLLGIEIQKNKTELKPLFESEPDVKDIKFHDKPIIDENYLSELEKTFYYLKYVTILPKFVEAVINKNTQFILEIPPVSEEQICEALNISYSLKTFHFYNIIQALLFTTKASRVDTEKETMKIIDLKYEDEGEKMVKDYIRKQFENQYTSDVTIKKHTEQSELSNSLVESILKADTHDKVVDLMRNGMTRGYVSHKIINTASLGFFDLKKRLVNLEESIPLRPNIIRIFLLGRDFMAEDEPVWNKGGVAFVQNLTEFGDVYKTCSTEEDWERIHAEYKERRIHIYREQLNRHGHGNEKPSFWAFGYVTLQLYKNDVTEEEFKKYCSEHKECCGVPQFLGLI